MEADPSTSLRSAQADGKRKWTSWQSPKSDENQLRLLEYFPLGRKAGHPELVEKINLRVSSLLDGYPIRDFASEKTTSGVSPWRTSRLSGKSAGNRTHFFGFLLLGNESSPSSPLKTPRKNYKKKVHKRIDLPSDFDRLILHPETGGKMVQVETSVRPPWFIRGKKRQLVSGITRRILSAKIEEMESG